MTGAWQGLGSWFRRNLLALIVIVVTLPLIAVVVVLLPALSDLPDPIPVAEQGETATIGPYEFTLTMSGELVGRGTGDEGNDIPLGMSLVGVLLEVEPLDDATEDDGVCDAVLSSRATGVEREWEAVDNEEDFNYGIADENTDFCILEGEAFGYETVFLTPTGVYEDATIDVTLKGETFRFGLVP